MIGLGFRWHAFHHEHGGLFDEDSVKVFVQIVALDVAETAQSEDNSLDAFRECGTSCSSHKSEINVLLTTTIHASEYRYLLT